MSKSLRQNIFYSAIAGILIWMLAASFFYAYALSLGNPRPPHLSVFKNEEFLNAASLAFPQKILQVLPWQPEAININTHLSINAASAIIIDTQNGNIIYEKNADALIPPASMTKLVLMYVVFQEITSGKINMDDIVPLPPETWAVNAPLYSSLMFLGEGQKVSVKELLLGLAVASGNDAAAALALYVSGSIESFIERMNTEVRQLGLKHTRFVDSSGYSEKNQTTAREFAAFARVYVNRYPESLEVFHRAKSISYPQKHNLPLHQKENTSPIVQKNTNPALGLIEGVNGLKTGFIFESGYNLALSIKRGETQIISVSMGARGRNSQEGNANRLKDARLISDYVYKNFKTVQKGNTVYLPRSVLGGKKNSLIVKEAWTTPLTVPASSKSLERRFDISQFLYSPLKMGQRVGTALYKVDGFLVAEIPLIADRNIEQADWFKLKIDLLAASAFKGLQQYKSLSMSLLKKLQKL